jgi:hypothetical protein
MFGHLALESTAQIWHNLLSIAMPAARAGRSPTSHSSIRPGTVAEVESGSIFPRGGELHGRHKRTTLESAAACIEEATAARVIPGHGIQTPARIGPPANRPRPRAPGAGKSSNPPERSKGILCRGSVPTARWGVRGRFRLRYAGQDDEKMIWRRTSPACLPTNEGRPPMESRPFS